MYMYKYNELSEFSSIEEFNEVKAAVIEMKRSELNTTDIEVIDFLSQHAVKAVGVAYLKVETIANFIGKSVRTIQRVTKKLAAIGIVKKVELMREKKGGNGANLYVFKSDVTVDATPSMSCRENTETLTESKSENSKLENKTLISLNSIKNSIKDIKYIDKNNNHSLVKDDNREVECEEVLFSDTHEELKQIYAGLDNKTGNNITKRLVSAYKNTGLAFESGYTLQDLMKIHKDLATEIVQTVKNCIKRHRNGNIHTTLLGYIYKSAERLFNNVLALKQAARDVVSEPLDLVNNEIAANLLKYRDEASTSFKVGMYIPVINFNNEELPF